MANKSSQRPTLVVWRFSVGALLLAMSAAKAQAPLQCQGTVQAWLDKRVSTAVATTQLATVLAAPVALEVRRYQSQQSRLGSQEQEVALSASVQNPLRAADLAIAEQQFNAYPTLNTQLQRWQLAALLLDSDQQHRTALLQKASLDQQVGWAQQLLSQLTSAQQAGEAVRLDVLQVQQQHSQLTLLRSQAEQAVAMAEQQLAQLLGSSSQVPCFTLPAEGVPAEDESARRALLATHPVWLLSQANEAQASWQYEQEGRWQSQPWQVSVAVRQQQAGPSAEVDQQLGISVRIPLGGNSNSLEQAQLLQQLHESQQQLATVRRTLERDLQAATLSWQQARVAAELAVSQQQGAEQRLAILASAYQAHELSLSDYLRLQQQAFQELAAAQLAPLTLQFARIRLVHTGGYVW